MVAVDRARNNALKTFQELSTRARGAVELSQVWRDSQRIFPHGCCTQRPASTPCHQVTVDVCVFAFDLLFVDGQPLLQEPLRQRRQLLAKALPQRTAGWLELATSVDFDAAVSTDHPEPRGPQPAMPSKQGAGDTDSTALLHADADGSVPSQRPQHEALEEHLLAALAAGAEGLMLKRMDARSTYEPSKRSDTCVQPMACSLWLLSVTHAPRVNAASGGSSSSATTRRPCVTASTWWSSARGMGKGGKPGGTPRFSWPCMTRRQRNSSRSGVA